MTSEVNELPARVRELEREVEVLRHSRSYRMVRRHSRIKIWGLPLYDIATGFVAVGGVARGVFALGGVAFGIVAMGGCAIGGLALGGGAIGLLAIGGGAIGLIAVGGGAIGYYACGGQALGQHVISPMVQDPEAVRFFQSWAPGIPGVLSQGKQQ